MREEYLARMKRMAFVGGKDDRKLLFEHAEALTQKSGRFQPFITLVLEKLD